MHNNFQDILQDEALIRERVLDRLCNKFAEIKSNANANMTFFLQGEEETKRAWQILNSMQDKSLRDFFADTIMDHRMSDNYCWKTEVAFIIEEDSNDLLLVMPNEETFSTEPLNIHDYVLMYDFIDCFKE